MVVAAKLKSFLDRSKVRYEVLGHDKRYTSPEIAEALHIPGQMLAKVVIVRVADGLRMAVLPANMLVDLDAFARAVGAPEATLATEKEFKEAFEDCEVGAMPPFGNLYDVPVVVDRSLTRDREIFFEAGNHREAIKLSYADFARLVRPTVADIGRH